ncbi:MAG TPA: CHAD domain-containing protein [Chloroflexia bacterium]|nr:CHAD domain-containing protein [Chloroflexia bacterium]
MPKERMPKEPGPVEPVEIEAKFVIPDAATLARLRQRSRFGPYRAGKGAPVTVHDRYLDTADHRFLAQRYALRLRETGTTRLLTLKRLADDPDGAVHRRAEYQAEVPGLEIAKWPKGEVRRRVKAIAGSAPLVDLVAVDQTRTVAILADGERAVAEWSLDVVTLPGADPPAEVYEMEIELLPDGTAADLTRLCTVFADTYHLAPQPLSKFERALRLAGLDVPAPPAPPAAAPAAGADAPPAGPGIGPADSILGAGRKVLRLQLDALRSQAKAARRAEDPGAVHKMRVATRRLRAALVIIAPALPGRQVKPLRRRLRDVARALGAVRDLDVLIAQAYAFRAILPEAEQPDLDGLLVDWQAARQEAGRQLRHRLDAPGYKQLKADLKAIIAAPDRPPDQRAAASPYQVRHVAGSMIWPAYAAVQAYAEVMAAPTIAQLHALRIAGKKLRYTLEFFQEVLPADAAALIADVTALQDQIGALHDADVAAGLIRTHLAGADHDPPAAGLMAYLTDRDDTVRTAGVSGAAAWAHLTSPAWRARLAAAIAGIE